MSTPVWLKAVMVQEGDDVVTRCCVVAGGQFFPVEVRVNIPGLIAQAKALGIDRAAQDQVGGFGSWLKKAVKKVTHSKIVKAVGHAVGKVVKSPVFAVAMPMQALGIHAAKKAITGKGLYTGTLGKIADLGASVVMSSVPAGAVASNALKFVGPQAAAALGVGMRAINVAQAGGAIAATAKMAQQKIDVAKLAARALSEKKVTAASVLPGIKQAVALRASVTKAGPALAKQVVQSAKVKTAFVNIVQKAKLGHPDAILASNVLAKSAKVLGTIQQLEQKNAGGVAGLLVTAQGRILRAPKGRFIQKAAAALHPDILYRGRDAPQLKGSFTAVSGVGASPGWGGDVDPGNDIDGPFQPVVDPGGSWQLDDYSAVAGVRVHHKKPRPYQPGIAPLKRALDHCAEAYDELAADFYEATGKDRSEYVPERVIDTSGVVGALTP